MKLEIINLSPTEQRVLLRFDPERMTPEDEAVDAYLQEHALKPKRLYHEERDGRSWLVYYFGHCYLEGHLDRLSAMSSG